MMLNSLSFCLSITFLFLCQVWMRALLGRLLLVVLSFHHFKYIVPFPSSLQELQLRNQLVTLWEFFYTLYIAFNVFSSSVMFGNLITMCLACSSLGLSFLVLSVLCGRGWLFNFPCWGSFRLLSFKYLLRSFLSLFLLWPLLMQI